MASNNEGLPADESPAAGDHNNLPQSFWEALSSGDEDQLNTVAALVRPHLVTIADSDVDIDDAGMGNGKLCVPLKVGSPRSLLTAWNKDGKTSLVVVKFEGMCLVKDPFDAGAGDVDFRACMTEKCQTISHRSVGTPSKFKLAPTEKDVGTVTLAIQVVPSSSRQRKATIFANPLLRLNDVPTWTGEGADRRLELLLNLSLKPRAFKVLMEGIPKEDVAAPRIQVDELVPEETRALMGTPRAEKSPASGGSGSYEEVRESPGLRSVLTDLPKADESDDDLDKKFLWNTSPSPSEVDSQPSPSEVDGQQEESDKSSDDSFTRSPSRLKKLELRFAELADQVDDLTDQLKEVTTDFDDYRLEAEEKEQDLGKVIRKLRHKQSVATTSHSHHPASGLTKSEKKAIIKDLVEGAHADDFLRMCSLAGLAKKTDLSAYVTGQELPNLGYATAADLKSNITDQLVDRLVKVEHEVLDTGGLLKGLEVQVAGLTSKKGESEVTMGGITFRDLPSCESWAQALGDILPFCSDMVMQLSALSSKVSSAENVIAGLANSIKAGFHDEQSAKTTASFSLVYTDAVFKISDAAKDVAKRGIKFSTLLSSAEVFEGNSEFSPKDDMLRTLKINRDRVQESIDARFPRNKSNHTKVNAVLSDILRLGYFQAVGFLESLLPFNKMMRQAGLSEEEAWGKCLTYAGAVFTRIYEVRTVASVRTIGSMLYGMMRATRLLQSYSELGWIRHPDVSSALVVAALQKDGRSRSEDLAKLKLKDPQVGTNKNDIAALKSRLTNVISKNKLSS